MPVAVLAVLLGGGGLAAIETQTVGDYGDGVLWALSLMTTVGFVGELPQTVGGKPIAAVLMLWGLGLLTMTTAAISPLFIQEYEEPEDRRERELETEILREAAHCPLAHWMSSSSDHGCRPRA